MATIGDSLPRVTRLQLIRDRLKPGAILRLHCSFTNPPKHKFMVLVAVEPFPIQFLINSEINAFIQARQELLACQVEIGPLAHECFTNTCFIDCREPVYMDLAEMEEQAVDDMDCYKGRLPEVVLQQIREAVEGAPTIDRQEKRWISEQL